MIKYIFNINKVKNDKSIENLIASLEKLKKSAVKKIINSKLKEFKKKRNDEELFSELSFCIMTANFNAEKSIKIQKEIGQGFLTFSEKKLKQKLKKLGYRYPNRASYIIQNRKYLHEIRNKDREWLVKNIKGFGMKEASHFLRNIGHNDYAIIDFHIIDLLRKYKIIKKIKSLSKKEYLRIEKILKEIAKKTKLNLAQLDLYLWFLETGKILK
ncbi:MAG: N-glycosylase/DNA lyase [Candidatus Pacearchaeota archaeon]